MTSASNTTSRKTGNHLLALYAAINHMVLRAWCATPSSWGRGTIRPGASNTFIELAVLAPTESGATSRPDFAEAGFPALHGFGRGAVVRKAAGMANSMLLTPRPPVARSKAAGGYQSQLGAETMTTSTVASRSAAPTTTPTTGNTTRIDSTSEEAQAFALLQASSDATMAKLYLSRGNVPAARRKAVQLLKALQLLEVAA